MTWRRDLRFGAETLDQEYHRLREAEDPHPGVSSLNEARADREANLEPAEAHPSRLRSQPACHAALVPPGPAAGAHGGTTALRQHPTSGKAA